MRFRMIRPALILMVMAVMAWIDVTVAAEGYGKRKRRPKPNEYGVTVIDIASTKNEIAAVAFPHWLHRSNYTCRLCHIDIGFAMTAGETGITEADNRNGLYCGACHDGTTAFRWAEISEKGAEKQNCVRCHSVGVADASHADFYAFRAEMPRERFGNGINWVEAEAQGLITPVDFLDTISFERRKLENPVDETLEAKEIMMPNIVFSHAAHTVWNGCEVCHPQIFGVKKEANQYTMQQIFDGLYCGACHGKVAFSSDDCQRCHTEPVS